MTTFASWNVNSVKARLEGIDRWLRESPPDVLMLQETKCETHKFPYDFFQDFGYNVEVVGQKSYNGVAICSKHPIDVIGTCLPGDEADTQARYLDVVTDNHRAICVYVPNGNPKGSEKFAYKQAWTQRLYDHLKEQINHLDSMVIGGDFNIVPEDKDCYDPKALADDAVFDPHAVALWRSITHLGLYDAFRLANTQAGHFSYWGHRQRAWDHDHGMRIDHFLISGKSCDLMEDCSIDRAPRGWPRPSDHTPIWLTLKS
ncbi:MAG: exodeoxyribonuclease III [Pseudomonadota bacterium]